MVRRDVAERKIAAAAAYLADAEELFTRPQEELLADKKGRDLAAFYVFLAVQETIDLAAHWVADSGWRPPDDVPSTFDVLAERGVIDPSLASRLHAAASLRNRIAHGYTTLDHQRLLEEFREGAETVRRFLARAAEVVGLGSS